MLSEEYKNYGMMLTKRANDYHKFDESQKQKDVENFFEKVMLECLKEADKGKRSYSFSSESIPWHNILYFDKLCRSAGVDVYSTDMDTFDFECNFPAKELMICW